MGALSGVEPGELARHAGLALAVGFFLGSIPFGLLVGKLRGVDITRVGSGNIGATNAARALGRAWGALVLVCDAGKAALPLWWARRWLDWPALDWVLAAGAFGAVLGHMFTPWLKGRGGKGVATGFGAFLVLAPRAVAIAAAAWVALFVATRTSSIGSLLAIVVLPIGIVLFHGSPATLALALALIPLIVWKHRGNIRRIARREEKKV